MLLHGLRSFTIFIYRLYDVYVLLICLLSYLLLICRLLADFMRFSCASCINHLFLSDFYLIFICFYMLFICFLSIIISGSYLLLIVIKQNCHRRLIETALSSQIRVLLLMTKKGTRSPMQSILYPCIVVSFIIPSASERPNGKLRIPFKI